jgi:two-component system NarL family sensor kinase
MCPKVHRLVGANALPQSGDFRYTWGRSTTHLGVGMLRMGFMVRAPSRAAVAAGGLFVIATAEVASAIVFGAMSSLTWAELVDLLVVSNCILGFVLAVAGWPIAVYRPRNLVGWSLLVGGCAWVSTGAGITLLAWVHERGWDGPLWRLIATVTNAGWTTALAVWLPLALLLLPDGRLPGRRWRWVLLLLAFNGLCFATLGILFGFSAAVGIGGYLAYPEIHSWPSWPMTVLSGMILGSYVVALAALLVRFHRGGEHIRRQLSWVLLALLVVVVVGALDPLLPDSIFTILPIALVPLSIMVAVLRYQLLDIRLVLSRSVLYVLVTAGVIGAYLAIVALFGEVLQAQAGLGPSLLATLAIAVAFNPVRIWLQRLVERAIYGARRDPTKAVAAVGARLGDVGAAEGAGLSSVLQALAGVMRFPWAAVVVNGVEIASYGDPPAARHAAPLRQGGDVIGELIIGLRPGESRLDPSDARVIDLVSAPIAAAVQAAALAEKLRSSREQVIAAREEERRRVRRDLHDGLGPVLTGVVLNAEAALRLLASDPARSADLLIQLRTQATAALDDIRRLVYDLRPPSLDSLGLVEALREHVAVLSRLEDAAPLQISVEAPTNLPELPAAVEVAAYRIVTEALTNVVRHSSASAAVVALSVHSGTLRIAVHDDGSNVEAGWRPGVGLTSIRERAAELGGRCRIEHDRTGGRVDVELPIGSVAQVPDRSALGDAVGP